jgi:hypothetical protein
MPGPYLEDGKGIPHRAADGVGMLLDDRSPNSFGRWAEDWSLIGG